MIQNCGGGGGGVEGCRFTGLLNTKLYTVMFMPLCKTSFIQKKLSVWVDSFLRNILNVLVLKW